MTKLLPQQRLFAIVVFISFCLHTALFISGTVQQMEQSRVYKGERILTQLTNEFSFPLVYKDRVSLSVIANDYAKQYDINRIVIRNAQDEILVESGVDPMLSGEHFATDIKVSKTIIGHIEITLKSVSHAEIIKFLWLFIIASLTIHLGVWFLYLSCSSPTEEDLQKIRDDVHEDFLQQQRVIAVGDNTSPIVRYPRKQAPKKVLMELADYIIGYKQNKPVLADNLSEYVDSKIKTETDTSQTAKVRQAETVITKDENKLKEKVHEHMNTNNKIIDATKPRMPIKKLSSKGGSVLFPKNTPKPKGSAGGYRDVDKQAKKIVRVKQSSLIKKRHNRPSLLNGQLTLTKLAVEFQFADSHHLLNRVMPVMANSYFELCSQFLQMSVYHLLKEEILQGVSLVNKPTFSIRGAKVELQTTSNNEKQLLLASTMLAVLYQMMNKVIYDFRREAKAFAFHMNVGISHIGEESILTEFNSFNADENVIISLQHSALKLIKNEVIINKNSEQKYDYIDDIKEDLLLTLIRIRNNILEID